jgi:DNA polymerase-3 subunit beta
MKIICAKQKLLENINNVQKAISGKSSMPVLECFYIGAENDSLRIIANDLHLAIEASNIPCEIREEGSVALSAHMFSDIIRNMPGGDITISADSRNVTVITSGKSEFKILGLPGDEFPFPDTVSRSENYAMPCGVLKDMIRRTIFSVSVEDTRQVMMGELIRFSENGSFTTAALDGFRIAVAYGKAGTKQALKPYSAIIPSKTMSELSKILPDSEKEDVNIFFSERNALFEFGNLKIVTRLIDGEFVNFDNIFKTEATTVMTANRQELCNSIDRTMLISTDQRKTPVRLNMRGNELIITSNAETGTVYEELSVNIDGNSLEIGFNPRFLAEALKVMDDETVRLEFTTPLSQCIIKQNDDKDDYKFLILPLRLKS